MKAVKRMALSSRCPGQHRARSTKCKTLTDSTDLQNFGAHEANSSTALWSFSSPILARAWSGKVQLGLFGHHVRSLRNDKWGRTQSAMRIPYLMRAWLAEDVIAFACIESTQYMYRVHSAAQLAMRSRDEDVLLYVCPAAASITLISTIAGSSAQTITGQPPMVASISKESFSRLARLEA